MKPFSRGQWAFVVIGLSLIVAWGSMLYGQRVRQSRQNRVSRARTMRVVEMAPCEGKCAWRVQLRYDTLTDSSWFVWHLVTSDCEGGECQCPPPQTKPPDSARIGDIFFTSCTRRPPINVSGCGGFCRWIMEQGKVEWELFRPEDETVCEPCGCNRPDLLNEWLPVGEKDHLPLTQRPPLAGENGPQGQPFFAHVWCAQQIIQ